MRIFFKSLNSYFCDAFKINQNFFRGRHTAQGKEGDTQHKGGRKAHSIWKGVRYTAQGRKEGTQHKERREIHMQHKEVRYRCIAKEVDIKGALA